MPVAWIDGRTGAIRTPAKGTSDGSHAAYSHPRLPGRGDNRAFLPHRRRLCPPQSQLAQLRVAQEALGLGGHNLGALPTTPRRRERTFLSARPQAVLL